MQQTQTSLGTPEPDGSDSRSLQERILRDCLNAFDPDEDGRGLLRQLVAALGGDAGFLAARHSRTSDGDSWVVTVEPEGAAPDGAPSWNQWDAVVNAEIAAQLDQGGGWIVDARAPHALSLVRGLLPKAERALLARLHHRGERLGLVGLSLPAALSDEHCTAARTSLADLLPTVAAAVGSAMLRRQRDAALHALHDQREGYRAVFEMAAVGIALIAPSGRLLDVNPRYCEIIGRSQAELLELSFADFTHPDDLAQDLALVEAAVSGHVPGSRFTREKRYLRPDGSTVWAVARAVLVRDAHGRPAHFVTTVEDITERKRYQDAMISAQAAERATRAKSEFLSRMSHELRTPLNAMLGFAQLLRVDSSQPLSSAQRQKIEHIERAGAHLLAMINDVLDLSRVESGVVPMVAETLRVGAVVEDALHLLGSAAREADVRLIYAPPVQELHVRADRVRLRQVLSNLLSNAVKYNYPGGRVSVVVGREQRRDGPCVSVAITDTGPGLTPEQIGRLFEPFNRLGAERSGVEGTGIGLVITRRLLDLMQGEVDVDSRPGRGSTFIVRLPLADTPSHEAPAAGEPAARYAARPDAGSSVDDAEEFLTSPSPLELEDQEASQTKRSFTVLYAEDNEVNVELVRQVMRMRPAYRLLVAHSGGQAIELARSMRPDMLLLDMHLGDMSGLDVVAVLDREAATAGIPRIALSADALPDQIRAARERGFKIYLTKPLDVGALLRALDDQAQAVVQPA